MLKSIEAQQSPLIVNTPTFFYRCLNNTDWSMTFIAGACDEVVGCSSAELLSNNISFGQIIDPKESERVWDIVQDAIKNKLPFHVAYHVKTPTNETKLLVEQGQGVYLHDQLIELCGFISIATPSLEVSVENCLQDYYLNLAEELFTFVNQKNNIHLTRKLTHREIETLVYLCKGMTMKEIGKQLAISPRTVEMHINRIRLGLNCYSKSELKKLFFSTKTGKKILSLL